MLKILFNLIGTHVISFQGQATNNTSLSHKRQAQFLPIFARVALLDIIKGNVSLFQALNNKTCFKNFKNMCLKQDKVILSQTYLNCRYVYRQYSIRASLLLTNVWLAFCDSHFINSKKDVQYPIFAHKFWYPYTLTLSPSPISLTICLAVTEGHSSNRLKTHDLCVQTSRLQVALAIIPLIRERHYYVTEIYHSLAEPGETQTPNSVNKF